MAAKKEYVSEAEMERSEIDTGKKLAAESKVKIMIAPDPKNPTFKCSINGYRFEFPRGEVVEVPESVAALISDLAQDMKSARAYEDTIKKGVNI